MKGINLILFIGCIMLVLALPLTLHYFGNSTNKKLNVEIKETGLYQGPVQQGYNETLFRETGKHKKLEEKN